MKNLSRVLCLSLVVLFANPLAVFPKTSLLTNRIEGVVYDPDRLPVENVNVELLDDVDSLVGQTKTTAAGRFTFSGMPIGRYVVKVLPLGTNFLQQSQEVVFDSAAKMGDTTYVDIYLRYDKRNKSGANETSGEIAFVQEVPAAAKKLFQEGIADFGKNQERGMAKLEEALRIVPEYFDALNWLGKSYISQQNYEKAYPYLIRAIEINPRSYSAYYSLGFALYQLKRYPAAVEAAKATAALSPDSIDTLLLYGPLLRITEKYPDAEKALLKANTLAKNTNAQIHWQLALLYNRMNRNKDAVAELEIYLKMVPDPADKNKVKEMIAKLKASGNK